MLGYLGEGKPKPRSTVYGPAPLPGTYPEYKGPPGPKQKACLGADGLWIGPTGKKWCQMPLAMASPGDTTFYPPGTQETTTQPAPWPDIGNTTPPVDTGTVDTGFESPAVPVFGDGNDLARRNIEDGAVWDAQAQRFVSQSTLTPTQRGSNALGLVVLVAAAGGILWYIAKKKKAGKTKGI